MGSEHAAALPPILMAPFAGLLLSIALLPLLAPHVWERWFPAVAAGWALLVVVPIGLLRGPFEATRLLLAVAAHDYLPFILLLLTLFVVSGGIRIAGSIPGTPGVNTLLLAIGTLAASLLGTTGASMLLIRPLIGANASRRRRTHIFVFFIFLVGNIGGALTPLGDPPLFLGFLRGIDFGWTPRALALPTAAAALPLLALFFLLDRWLWRREAAPHLSRGQFRIAVDGWHNAIFLAAVVLAVLGSGVWRSGVAIDLGLGVDMKLENLLRDAVLLAVALASYLSTPARIRIENAFTWTPIREVAILFAGIFVTIAPVLEALGRGREGPFAPLLSLVTSPDGTPSEPAFFWLTGALSSLLDNAPTYLVFFDLAGGDPLALMGPLQRTLTAISAGAVFMGALTYLGNAPNFMIKAICEERGIRMPGFFGYLVWSVPILLPLFALVTVLFFR